MTTVVTFDPLGVGTNIMDCMNAARAEYAGAKLVIHYKTDEQRATIMRFLQLLEGTQILLELECDVNPRTYHNGSKVIELYFEDYANRNGWRRDYVPVATWKTAALDRLVAVNAS